MTIYVGKSSALAVASSPLEQVTALLKPITAVILRLSGTASVQVLLWLSILTSLNNAYILSYVVTFL
jgi:hypothetical protein